MLSVAEVEEKRNYDVSYEASNQHNTDEGRSSCFQSIRRGSGWVYLKRRVVPGLKDDGGQQLEGSTIAANSGQDYNGRGPRRGW